MSDYSQLRQSIDSLKYTIDDTSKKVGRLLIWAEGDKQLGTPSIKDQIDENKKTIQEVNKRTHENEDKIKDVNHDVKLIKKQAGGIGAASGGVIFAIIEGIRRLFIP